MSDSDTPLLHRYDSGVIRGRSLPLNCDSQAVDVEKVLGLYCTATLWAADKQRQRVEKYPSGGDCEARREIMQINSSTLFMGQSSWTESDARRGERCKHLGRKQLGRVDANHRRGATRERTALR